MVLVVPATFVVTMFVSVLPPVLFLLLLPVLLSWWEGEHFFLAMLLLPVPVGDQLPLFPGLHLIPLLLV